MTGFLSIPLHAYSISAVTGVLLAFVCAPTLPYWMLIIGDFFAIVVVKQLFGGLGKNFMNPALGGRAFLMLCYPVAMTTWVAPGHRHRRLGRPAGRHQDHGRGGYRQQRNPLVC